MKQTELSELPAWKAAIADYLASLDVSQGRELDLRLVLERIEVLARLKQGLTLPVVDALT